MKKSMQRSLALIMAVLMVFGAAPILGIGMIGMAAGDLVSISVLPENMVMKPGEDNARTFRAAGRDKDGNAIPLNESAVQWAVSNTDVATIDPASGKVIVTSGTAAGTTFSVQARYAVGGVTLGASSTVKVVTDDKVAVKSIGIVPDSLSLSVGQDFQLTAMGYSELNKKGNAVILDNENLSWSSKNTEFVKIESDGIVKALKTTIVNGKNQPVIVNVTYQDPEAGTVLAASISVSVDDAKVSLRSISVAPTEITVAVGEDVQLKAAGHGTDGKEYPLIPSEVLWISSNTKYVTVTNNASGGGLVSAVAYTSEPISVSAFYTDGNGVNHTASCIVKILKSVDPVVSIIVVPDYTTIGIGSKFNMQASGLTKAGKQVALEPDKLSWASGDTTLVGITNDGVVTGLATTGPDGVKVTATYEATRIREDGEEETYFVAGKATVVVQQKVDQIIWDWSADALLAGETYSYADKYKIIPSNASNKEVILTADDNSIIVEIDQKAQTFKVLEFTGGGTAKAVKLTLTAKDAADGCKPATKQMWVYNDVPLTAVHWKLNTDSNGISYFPFYGGADVKEKNKRNGVSEDYWFAPTKSNEVIKYKYEVEPAGSLNLVDIKIESSDPRIMKIDMKTKRFIPVGNGRCTLKITATTPKQSIVKEDYATVEVYDSLYTPITNVTLYIDNARTNLNNVEFPANNKVTLGYKKTATFVPGLPQKEDANGKMVTVGQGTFDFETFTKRLEDNRTITVYEALDRKWTTSDGGAVEVKMEKDGAGTAKAVAPKDSTVTLILTDNNGKEPVVYKPSVTVQTRISPIQAIWAILLLLFTFQWGKIPRWAGAVC